MKEVIEMQVTLEEYLKKEKANYERGLVTKGDVKMWISLYISAAFSADEWVKTLEDAKAEVDSW
jgi:hypothetical protein